MRNHFPVKEKKNLVKNLVLVVGHVGPADRRHGVVNAKLNPSLKSWRNLFEYTNLISQRSYEVIHIEYVFELTAHIRNQSTTSREVK